MHNSRADGVDQCELHLEKKTTKQTSTLMGSPALMLTVWCARLNGANGYQL